ncbi:MAG: hypothetical protein ACRD0J_04030 [Acidimicrobiales bacterium]
MAAGPPRLAAGSARLAAGSARLAAGSARLAAGSPSRPAAPSRPGRSGTQVRGGSCPPRRGGTRGESRPTRRTPGRRAMPRAGGGRRRRPGYVPPSGSPWAGRPSPRW